MIDKINLAEKFNGISDFWNPRIATELNGQQVKLVKIKGEFVWHHHEHEDELFYVVKGSFIMHFRDGEVAMKEGDMIVIPRGVEHKPEATEEAHILLFEPAGTVNTGDVQSHLTRQHIQHI